MRKHGFEETAERIGRRGDRNRQMTNANWTPKMEELAQKHYTQAQLQELRARRMAIERNATLATISRLLFL